MKNIILSNDPCISRRQVNQHNIDCLTEGKMSILCDNRVTVCHDIWPFDTRTICCERCMHRNDMTDFPERAFIGYTPQKSQKEIKYSFKGRVSFDLPDDIDVYSKNLISQGKENRK